MAQYRAISNRQSKENSDVLENEIKGPSSLVGRTKSKIEIFMILAFLFGVASAIAHDRFYAHFHHRLVGTGFEQNVVHSTGNALAFLTKLLLALAAGIAYTQHFWLNSSQTPATIDQIDSMTSIFSNIFYFLDFTVWTQHIILWIIAVVVWCLPLAAIFTPGAITVQPTSINSSIIETPPQFQQSWIGQQHFASTKIDPTATVCTVNTPEQQLCYEDVMIRSPTVDLSRAAQLSAFQNAIMVPTPISPRMSYNLSFFGPALSCTGFSDDDKQTFNDSLTSAYKAKSIWKMNTFTDTLDHDYEMLYNAWTQSYQSPVGSLKDPDWNNQTVNYTPNGQDGGSELVYIRSTNPQESFGMVLLNCSLHNASYNVDYFYNDTEKNASLTQFKLLDRYPYNSSVLVDNPNYVNTVYYSVLFAWNQLMIGVITNASNYDTPPSNGGLSMLYTFQDFILDPSLATASAVSNRLESLFQNITISAISAPSLQANSTEAKAMSVLTFSNTNWYVYEPKILYIAYGIAILVSLISVGIGMVAIEKNGFGFDLDFSTIVSTSRNLKYDYFYQENMKTKVMLRDQAFEVVQDGVMQLNRINVWPGDNRNWNYQ